VGVISVPAALTVPSPTPVTVLVVTGDVPPRAFPHIDYEPIDSMPVTFAPGETYKLIEVAVLDDSLIEDEERFHIRIFQPTFNARLGSVNYFVATIADDDLPTISFAQPDMFVYEADGKAVVPIVTTNPTPHEVHVRVVTERRSATPEKDYWPIDTVITLAPFETRTHVELPLVNDNNLEDTVGVVLRLLEVSASANIGFPDTIRLSIVDDDFRPNFKFTTRGVTVAEATNLPFNAVHAVVELAYPHPQPVRFVGYQANGQVCVAGDGPHGLRQFHTVKAGHVQVGEQQVARCTLEVFQRLGAIGGGVDEVIGAGEAAFEDAK